MNANLPETSAPAIEPAQGDRLPLSRFALFFLPLIVGLVADLWTKSYMFRHYYDPEQIHATPTWWIDGILGIQTSHNPGALFGIGGGLSWLFAAFSVVAILGVLAWLFKFDGIRDRWLTFALGLITGGILGNLYDRVGLGFTPGHPESVRDNVRDWIYFRLEGVPVFDPWPNFNIADSALVCGAILLFIHAVLLQPAEQPESQQSEPTNSEQTSSSHV